MKHLESNDIVSIELDEYRMVSEEGIIVSKADAILENEQHRKATVFSAPEFYTVVRNRGDKRIEIKVPCPVKAGDRVLISKYGGLGTTQHEGRTLTMVRVHEILGLIEEHGNDTCTA